MFDMRADLDPSFTNPISDRARGVAASGRLASAGSTDRPDGVRPDGAAPDDPPSGLDEPVDDLLDGLRLVDTVFDRILAGLPGRDASATLTLAGRLARLTARLEGLTIHAQVHLARQRPPNPAAGDEADDPYAGLAADELAAELGQAPRTMSSRLAAAWEIAHQLPAGLAELTAGLLDHTRLFALHQLTATLTAEDRASIETSMLAGGRLASPPRWRRKIHRVIAKLDPDAAARRRKQAKASRCLGIQPLDDGMAQITATLPAEDARAIYDRIDHIARHLAPALGPSRGGTRSHTNGPEGAGRHGVPRDDVGRGNPEPSGASPGNAESSGIGPRDTRTIDARRADVFTALLLGNRREYVTVELQVIAPVGTLAGLDDNPAELIGYGPIPAGVGRALAADARWRRVLTDPAAGTVLDLGHRRVPTPALARLVRHQQTRCVFVGCGMPASRTDLDHTLAHADGGSTALDNLGLLCRRHHGAKHRGGWQLTQPQPGVFLWTSPTGRIYTTDTTNNDEDADAPRPVGVSD